MTLTPPTTSETEASKASRSVSVRIEDCCARSAETGSVILKSLRALDTMPATQQDRDARLDLFEAIGVGFHQDVGERLPRNGIGPSHEPLSCRLDRDEGDIVLILAVPHRPLGFQNADQPQRLAEDPDGLSDRVVAGEKLGRGRGAEDDHFRGLIELVGIKHATPFRLPVPNGELRVRRARQKCRPVPISANDLDVSADHRSSRDDACLSRDRREVAVVELAAIVASANDAVSFRRGGFHHHDIHTERSDLIAQCGFGTLSDGDVGDD